MLWIRLSAEIEIRQKNPQQMLLCQGSLMITNHHKTVNSIFCKLTTAENMV